MIHPPKKGDFMKTELEVRKRAMRIFEDYLKDHQEIPRSLLDTTLGNLVTTANLPISDFFNLRKFFMLYYHRRARGNCTHLENDIITTSKVRYAKCRRCGFVQLRGRVKNEI